MTTDEMMSIAREVGQRTGLPDSLALPFVKQAVAAEFDGARLIPDHQVSGWVVAWWKILDSGKSDLPFADCLDCLREARRMGPPPPIRRKSRRATK